MLNKTRTIVKNSVSSVFGVNMSDFRQHFLGINEVLSRGINGKSDEIR